MPSRALTSGRKFSTTTSACSASRLNTSRPLESFRFSVMARLLRCKFWKSEPWRGPPGCSPPLSSSSASILMTLAPQSASCRTQVGPERTRVRSSTVKRDRADEACGEGIQELRSFVSFQDLAVLARRYRCYLVLFNTLFPRNRQNYDSGNLASGDSSPGNVEIGPLSRSLSHRKRLTTTGVRLKNRERSGETVATDQSGSSFRSIPA